MTDPWGDHCTPVSVRPGAPAPAGSGTGWDARRPVGAAITSRWAPWAREGPQGLVHAAYASFVPSGDHENSRTFAAIRVRRRPSLDATKSTWSSPGGGSTNGPGVGSTWTNAIRVPSGDQRPSNAYALSTVEITFPVSSVTSSARTPYPKRWASSFEPSGDHSRAA